MVTIIMYCAPYNASYNYENNQIKKYLGKTVHSKNVLQVLNVRKIVNN